jgi:uncharacterized repeat protein (TIGR03803 family)
MTHSLCMNTRNPIQWAMILSALLLASAGAQTYSVIKDFSGTDGQGPGGPLVLSGNRLYGTTYAGGSWDLGTLFRIHTNGSKFSVIREFSGSDGANPGGGLIRSGSVLYGTTYAGGNFGCGVIFSLDLSPVVAANPTGNLVELSWPSAAGLEYQVQFKTQLSQPAWTDFDSPTTATGPTATATDPVEPRQQRFYRALLLE